jgi:hypothetical protein
MPHVRGDTNFGACTLSEPLVKYTNIEIARQNKKKKKRTSYCHQETPKS